jgi:hypothetical protein
MTYFNKLLFALRIKTLHQLGESEVARLNDFFETTFFFSHEDSGYRANSKIYLTKSEQKIRARINRDIRKKFLDLKITSVEVLFDSEYIVVFDHKNHSINEWSNNIITYGTKKPKKL